MPITLYYLDDDADDRMLFDDVMQDLGQQRPLLFDSGRELLDTLRHSLPECPVLFTDLNMPRMNGFEVLKALRSDARFNDIPIIVLSTDGAQATKDRCKILGATAYLTKANSMGKMKEQFSQLLSVDWRMWRTAHHSGRLLF